MKTKSLVQGLDELLRQLRLPSSNVDAALVDLLSLWAARAANVSSKRPFSPPPHSPLGNTRPALTPPSIRTLHSAYPSLTCAARAVRLATCLDRVPRSSGETQRAKRPRLSMQLEDSERGRNLSNGGVGPSVGPVPSHAGPDSSVYGSNLVRPSQCFCFN